MGDYCIYASLEIRSGNSSFQNLFQRKFEEEYSMNHQETFDYKNVMEEVSALELNQNSNINGKFEKSIITFIINNYLGGYYGGESSTEDTRQMTNNREERQVSQDWRLKFKDIWHFVTFFLKYEIELDDEFDEL